RARGRRSAPGRVRQQVRACRAMRHGNAIARSVRSNGALRGGRFQALGFRQFFFGWLLANDRAARLLSLPAGYASALSVWLRSEWSTAPGALHALPVGDRYAARRTQMRIAAAGEWAPHPLYWLHTIRIGQHAEAARALAWEAECEEA